MATELNLTAPVTVDGTTFPVLTIRRPKARDLLRVGHETTDPEEREIILFAWLAGVQRKVIEELDIYDYRRLQETYATFTETPPTAPVGV